MACTDLEDPALERQVADLFARLEALGSPGLERLHPIEREILDSLAERPKRSWCLGVLWLLERLVAKASGGTT